MEHCCCSRLIPASTASWVARKSAVTRGASPRMPTANSTSATAANLLVTIWPAQIDFTVRSDRQGNANRRAAARTGFDFDSAAVRFDDASHDLQTQTGSFGLGGVEQRSKRPLALLLRHSVARISELHDDVRGCFLD